jgi:hypothetical protein
MVMMMMVGPQGTPLVEGHRRPAMPEILKFLKDELTYLKKEVK